MEVSKLKFVGHSIHGVLPRPSRMQQETSNPLHHRSQNPQQQKPRTHQPKSLNLLPTPSLSQSYKTETYPSFIHATPILQVIIFHHLPISPKFPHSRITTMQTISIQRNCFPSLLHLCSRIYVEDGLL